MQQSEPRVGSKFVVRLSVLFTVLLFGLVGLDLYLSYRFDIKTLAPMLISSTAVGLTLIRLNTLSGKAPVWLGLLLGALIVPVLVGEEMRIHMGISHVLDAFGFLLVGGYLLVLSRCWRSPGPERTTHP